jgi:hypothetical protein
MIQNIRGASPINVDDLSDATESNPPRRTSRRTETRMRASPSSSESSRDNAAEEPQNPTNERDPIYIHDNSDSPAIDLCDSDLSDVEVVGISHFPIVNRSSTSAESERRPRDVSPFEDMLIHFPWGSNSSSESFGLSMFQHIQERIRTQAMLIERLRLFNVDTRPTIPPMTIINCMKIRKIKDTAEAASLGTCPICLEIYRPRMTVRILPGCGHMVHKPCMDKWIMKSLKYTCPLDNKAIEIPESGVLVEPQPSRALRRSTRQRQSH